MVERLKSIYKEQAHNAEIYFFMKSIGKCFIYLSFVVLFCPSVFSQFPVVPSVPRPATMQPGVIIQGARPGNWQPTSFGYGTSVQEQNARIIQEVDNINGRCKCRIKG
jgi:hypothetical protein